MALRATRVMQDRRTRRRRTRSARRRGAVDDYPFDPKEPPGDPPPT